MSGIVPRNLKKNDVSDSNRFPGVQKRGIHTETQTHTHTDTHTHTHMSTAIGETQCVAFRLKINIIIFPEQIEILSKNYVMSKITQDGSNQLESDTARDVRTLNYPK